jgi:DNA-directed RNA polymerase subunit E'/Rpb7
MDNVYQPALLTRLITIPMNEIGGDVKYLIKNAMKSLEGKCLEEGYLQRDSIEVVRFSYGVLKGASVTFNVVFKCNLANPIAGQKIKCIVENNTKAGVKARLESRENPFIIFLSRDHHYQNPDFSELKERDRITISVLGQRYDIHDKQISIIGLWQQEIKVKEPEPEPKKEDPSKTDKLIFYSGSKNVAPGKGSSEYISTPSEYKELAKIDQFRKQLSNFDVAPFTWTGEGVLEKPFPPGTSWNTIEHAYQASKFKTYKHDAFAYEFSLTSDTALGKGDGALAQSNRKKIVIKDMKKWGEMSASVMEDIANAKYSQNPDRLKMLKATNQAELWHHVSRSKPVRFIHLEKIRENL